jgi:hypothetical protein
LCGDDTKAHRFGLHVAPVSTLASLPGLPIQQARAVSGRHWHDTLLVPLDDMNAARDELLSRCVEVREVFHGAGGGLAGRFRAGTDGRPGPDPEGRS